MILQYANYKYKDKSNRLINEICHHSSYEQIILPHKNLYNLVVISNVVLRINQLQPTNVVIIIYEENFKTINGGISKQDKQFLLDVQYKLLSIFKYLRIQLYFISKHRNVKQLQLIK
jgi:hypothetical protein